MEKDENIVGKIIDFLVPNSARIREVFNFARPFWKQLGNENENLTSAPVNNGLSLNDTGK